MAAASAIFKWPRLKNKELISAKHTFFNTGERTIDFKPAEAKTFNLVCRLGAETTGAMRLTIAKVYENQTLDGKTAGKVVASNIEWKTGIAA